MKLKSRSCHLLAACFALPFIGSSAHAGTFTFGNFFGDATSGVSPSISYTTKADFAGTGTRTVNGVTFNENGLAGANYALSGTTNTFTGYASNVTGTSNGLISDFYFGGNGNAQMNLTGLTVGQKYQSTWYNAAFGGAGSRVVDITPSDTGLRTRFDENVSGANNGNLLRYTFTATSPNMQYTFDALNDPDSFHHYAFTNGVAAAAPLPFTLPTIQTSSGPGPGFSPFTPLNNDLLQNPSALLGVSSSGNFSQEGGGGVAALTNGIFTINGGNPSNNSQLATGENNAFVQYDLNTTLNVQGYTISSISGFGGWNDGGRDKQLYNVSYSLVGSPSFTLLGTANADGVSVGGNPSAVLAVFNPENLSGVDAIRFDFLPGQENGYAGYGEFDVVGFATPEPGRMSLAMLGIAAFAFRRRRSRK